MSPAHGKGLLIEENRELKSRITALEAQLEGQKVLAGRLQAFLEFASQGVVVADSAGKMMLVNMKTEELFGYERSELTGQPLEMLLPERFREGHVGQRRSYFSHPRNRPMGVGLDLAGRRKNGTEFPVEISLSYISEADRQVALALITDISERKRLEEQLRHTQKLESLGVLAGGVAHDFNNLLTGIMGNASLAVDAISPANPARTFLENIMTTSQRAADLTRQLLAYAGKGRFIISKLDLSEVVREITNLVQASIPKTVQLRLQLQAGLPRVEADASQIQQIVMNLVINAAEAIGEGTNGTVIVTTGVQNVDEHYIRTVFAENEIAPGKYVFLEVSDTGCGMSDETRARIFDPFFTTKFTGRGLGLAAVSGIVRGHKGAIKVYSTPGKGTTFKVLFPVAEAAVAEEAPEPTDLSGTGVVLVVDDEAIIRQTAKASLQRYGYTVLLAEDGQSALDLFAAMPDRIALVLLDMTMPGLSGEEALRQLLQIRPKVRVLLSSGYNEVEAIRRFTGKGLAGFIQKPYTAAQLAERIKAAVEG